MMSHQPRSTLFPYTTLFRSLQQCTSLMLRGLQLRQRSTSTSTCVLGAGACTEIPLAELARDSDEVVLADYDLASIDRKSTRLNSSHRTISYAVFCLKKKK